ncbi:MAG TPA: peroxiredoxin [Polyangia bacterium]|nr:peroxiredoxin [Polyangia bacterium]
MLKIGDHAPDFTAQATNGSTVSLGALRGRPVVVYFFPKAFTMGCTVETRHFCDNYHRIRELGAEIIGISADKFDAQCRFATENRAPFPLVGDEDKRICEAFGVLWPLIKIPQRITFVIDEEGIVRAVFHHEVQISRHLDDVREFLESRARRAAAT